MLPDRSGTSTRDSQAERLDWAESELSGDQTPRA